MHRVLQVCLWSSWQGGQLMGGCLLSCTLGPETPLMEQIPGPFGYSQSTCDLPPCMPKEFMLPETEALIGSLVTFNMESPNWAQNLVKCSWPP